MSRQQDQVVGLIIAGVALLGVLMLSLVVWIAKTDAKRRTGDKSYVDTARIEEERRQASRAVEVAEKERKAREEHDADGLVLLASVVSPRPRCPCLHSRLNTMAVKRG
jgi:hypothetical protein